MMLDQIQKVMDARMIVKGSCKIGNAKEEMIKVQQNASLQEYRKDWPILLRELLKNQQL